MHPTLIPALDTYYRSLPLVSKSALETYVDSKDIHYHKNTSDPFTRLAAETVLQIASNLDISSFKHLRASSPAVANVILTSSWWRLRLENDMPWLFDLPTMHLQGEIDWARVYDDLWACSSSNASSDIKIHGLVNRKRIWQICETILSTYEDCKTRRERRALDDIPEILLDSVVSSTPLLSSQECSTLSQGQVSLVKRFVKVPFCNPVISVYWGATGNLVGLSIHDDTSEAVMHHQILGLNSQSSRHDEIPIPQGD